MNERPFEKILSLGTLLGVTAFAMGLLLFPLDTSKAAVNGIKLCVNSVFPSLFPFFVVSSMLISSGCIERAALFLQEIAGRIFGVSGVGFSAFLLGLIGGYPVGIRTASELYKNGRISKNEYRRLCLFCNNAGPAFIMSFVGGVIFRDGKIGVLLYFTHIAAAVIIAAVINIFSKEKFEAQPAPFIKPKSFTASFIHGVTNGVSSMLSVSGFIIFFSVFITVLEKSGILPALSSLLKPFFNDEHILNAMLTGFFEMTGGLALLNNGGFAVSLVSSSFLLGWAGMSVHFQAMSFMSDAGVSVKGYLPSKLAQGALSACVTALYLKLCPPSKSVFFTDYTLLTAMGEDFYMQYIRGSLILTGILIVFVLIFYFSIVFFVEKMYNKKSKNKLTKRGGTPCFTEKASSRNAPTALRAQK